MVAAYDGQLAVNLAAVQFWTTRHAFAPKECNRTVGLYQTVSGEPTPLPFGRTRADSVDGQDAPTLAN